MRLIDAERLREIVEDGLRNNPHNEGYARTCHRIEYTHFLDVICRMPTITPPPNDPLALDQLREMDGEPVWVIPMRGSGGFCAWMLVDAEYELCREAHGEMVVFENCGKTWLAYRRKPGEGTQ